MKPKLKECSFCKTKTVLWKSNPKACKPCWLKNRAKVGQEGQKVKEWKTKRVKSIKQMSDKRAEELKKYREVRDKYIKKNPVCQFPGCSSREIDLHHIAGRTGSMLYNPKYFSSLCRKHHRWVHENDAEAREMGFLVSRLSEGL